jgi:hypothetical protein
MKMDPFRDRDPTGFLAQFLAIGLAMVVSIPLIASHPELSGAVAPVSVSVPNISLVGNGTLAVLLALRAAGVRGGSVVTTPFTFPATTHFPSTCLLVTSAKESRGPPLRTSHCSTKGATYFPAARENARMKSLIGPI